MILSPIVSTVWQTVIFCPDVCSLLTLSLQHHIPMHPCLCALCRFVVGVARSGDGFNWKKSGIVFDPVEAGAQPGDHDYLGASARHVVGVAVNGWKVGRLGSWKLGRRCKLAWAAGRS